MKWLLIFFASMLLFGCVKTMDSGGVKVDEQKALEANIKLGMAYLQKGDRDRALLSFNKAQELDKKSGDAYHGLALVHQVNGEHELAEKQFRQALKLRSDFSRASIELSFSRFLYEQSRFEEAMTYLQKSSDDIGYRNRETALYYLGLCSLKTGDRVRAIGSFEHALNLKKRYAPAAIELAFLSFEDSDFENSKKYLDIYSSNASQSARSLLLGIKIERIFGNKDKEASYALALKNLHPYSKEYLEYKNMKK